MPFVIVSGAVGEETAVEAMRRGAHDFVLKEKLGRLAPAVERGLRERTERAARRQAEDALRDSREHLRDAVRARDAFLAIASHELKTPLTSLSLEIDSARRLLQGRDAPVPVEKLEAKLLRVSFQITRLTALINNFLDVTRITSTRLALSPETCDLREELQSVLAGIRELVARSGSTVNVHTDAPVVGNWDRLTLESVILNLLTNAIKYGEGKPIEIVADVRADQACLVVRDPRDSPQTQPAAAPGDPSCRDRPGSAAAFVGDGFGLDHRR